MKCYAAEYLSAVARQEQGDYQWAPVPHWLWSDRYTFEQNLRLIDGGPTNVPHLANFLISEFAGREAMRLREKARHLSEICSRDDVEIVLPDGYSERDYSERQRAALQQLLGQ